METFLFIVIIALVVGFLVYFFKNKKSNTENEEEKQEEQKTETPAYVPKYELKQCVVTECERDYIGVIEQELSENQILLVQQPLNTFITKIKQYPGEWQSELNRVVDFLVVSEEYRPLAVIEINDHLHKTTEKKARDEKVKDICGKAGIPILMLETSDDEKSEIRAKIRQMLMTVE